MASPLSSLSDRWDLVGAVFKSFLPISSTPEKSASFVGGNVRVEYKFASFKDPWALTLGVGPYYTTMSVPQNAFGFNDESGFQIYSSLGRRVGSEKYFTLYLKFAPISEGVGKFSISSYDASAGLIYQFTKIGNHPLSLIGDFSTLSAYSAASGTSSSQIQFSSQTYSLGSSIQF